MFWGLIISQSSDDDWQNTQSIVKTQKNQGWNSKISSESHLFSVCGLFGKTNFPPARVTKDVTVDHTLLNRKADFETAQCYTLHTWSWRKTVFCLSFKALLTGDYGVSFLEYSFVLALRLLLLTPSILSDKNFFLTKITWGEYFLFHWLGVVMAGNTGYVIGMTLKSGPENMSLKHPQASASSPWGSRRMIATYHYSLKWFKTTQN